MRCEVKILINKSKVLPYVFKLDATCFTYASIELKAIEDALKMVQ